MSFDPDLQDKDLINANVVGRGEGKDKSIKVGEVNNATGDAIGDHAQVVIQQAPPAPKPGSAPPLPSLIIGCEDDLHNLKARLGLMGETSLQALTAADG